MKILKNRSISVADEDKWTVRLLRQEYSLIEQQKTYKMITDEEYDEVVDFAVSLGIENAFVQDGEAVSESFIPPFDLEGV